MSEYTRKPRSTRRKRAPRILLVLCLMLVVMVGSIAGTVAWLTATSDQVTNTFTIGDINITLTETTGTDYKIIPGGTVSKDPKVTVQSGSEKCWVYVSIENNLLVNNESIATYDIDTSKWKLVGQSGNKKLYRYNDVVDAATANQEVAVFTQVTISGNISKSDFTNIGTKTIVLNAYAHQSANTNTTTADAAANAWASTTAVSTTVTDN